MAEYECSPVWSKNTRDIIFENTDIDDAPFSGQLKEKIKRWDAIYQNTYNANTPQDSGFASDADEAMFEKYGLELAIEIYIEIGSDFIVVYRNVLKGITYYPPYYQLDHRNGI